MRELTEHKVNPANDKLSIRVLDEPGSGNAHHVYSIGIEDAVTDFCRIGFQNGPINEVGVNGVTQEALLAIIADRLRSFQAGPYACRENALALTKIEEAQHWLHSRTKVRMERGVEGTHAV